MRRSFDYNEWILNNHYKWIDNQLILNESVRFDKTIHFLSKLLKKISGLSSEHKRKIIKYGLTTLLLTTPSEYITKAINSNISLKYEMEKILKQKELDEILKNYKNVDELKLSKKGLDHLKYEEGSSKYKGEPILTAYDIGDGKITIGWGHAEPIESSEFEVGQTITKEKAQMLLSEDIKTHESEIKKLFRKWKEEGTNIKITQGMYDALISMSFNMGPTGLRNSKVVEEIKKKNFKEAGELIKKMPHKKKFNGLTSRRERESELFLTGLKNLQNVYEKYVASKGDLIEYILSSQDVSFRDYTKEDLENMDMNELKMLTNQITIFNSEGEYNTPMKYTSANNRKMNQHSFDSPNL